VHKSSNRPGDAVIVRSWGDEPVRLRVYRVENNGNTVFVGPEHGEGRAIGLPSEQIYEFTDAVHRLLHDAYSAADFDKIRQIYGDCNKYKNKVDSST
jgi:hypothetical protein